MQILHQLQVAEDIFDLGAVVEREAPDHVVLNLISPQRFFYKARLRVGAIKYGATRKIIKSASLTKIFLDTVSDEERFVLAIGSFVKTEQRAALARGPKRLALPLSILRDHCASALENHLSRAVILFKTDRLCPLEILLKLQDVFNIRAAPTIDGLIFIADDTDVRALAR